MSHAPESSQNRPLCPQADAPAPMPAPALTAFAASRPFDFAVWRNGILARSENETASLAAQLAAQLPANTALALHGGLGAGKTTFSRAFAEALGVRENVTSPSFAIFNLYEAPSRQFAHVDAYRLSSPEDADALLLWDLLRPPWTLLVEWPENLGDRLPASAWHLHIAPLPFPAPETHRCLRLE